MNDNQVDQLSTTAAPVANSDTAIKLLTNRNSTGLTVETNRYIICQYILSTTQYTAHICSVNNTKIRCRYNHS